MNGPQNNELDQKNLLLAVVLSAGVLMVWQMLSPPPPPVQPPPEVNTTNSTSSPAASAGQQTPSVSPATPATSATKALARPSMTRSVLVTLQKAERNALKLVNVDGQIGSWILTEEQYRQREKDAPSRPFAFVDQPEGKLERSLFLPPTIGLSLKGQPTLGAYTVISSTEQKAVLGWTDPVTGIKVTRSYTLDADNYRIDVAVKLDNPGGQTVPYDLNARFPALQDDSQSEGSMFMPPIYVYESLCKRNEDFERLTAVDIRDNIEDKDPNAFTDGIRWAGIGNRYFMTGLIADEKMIERCSARVDKAQTPGFTRIETHLDIVGGEVLPGQSVVRNFTIYGGPKKLSALHNQKSA